MKDFLATSLKFQSSFGVDLSFDFITGRDYNNKQLDVEQKIENVLEKEEKDDNKQTNKIQLDNITSFDELINEINNFNECNLKRTATNTVIFDGNKNANIMLIGEAPGESEDIEGKPFCGQSGKLLRKALNFIGLNENTMLITNTVFWRPPLNRKPTQDEIAMCYPFIEKMIEIVKPKLIILCGATSAETMLKTTEKMGKITGTIKELKILNKTIKAFTIYHPSYLLRVPSQKKVFWEHLIKLSQELKMLINE